MSEHEEFVEEQDLPEAEEAEEAAVGPALVDLNTATVDDLRQLPGIGQALAARIVNYRVEVQPFQEPADITAVPGVSDGVYERIAESLTVTPIEVVEAETEVEAEEESAPEIEAEVETPEEPESEIEAEPEADGYDDAYEPEPESELEVEEMAEIEMEVAPVRVITESQAKWGRLLFVGLVSALVGAALALVVVYAINGTLDFRTATERTVRAEAYRLDGEMDALGGELDQLILRLDSMQDLAPVVEEAQADIQNLSRDLASAEAMLESVADDLAGAQISLAAMAEDIAGLEDETAGLGEDLGALGQQVGALEERVDTMDEELQNLIEAAERFDAFLDGLRQLLGESGTPGGSDLTPFPTPTPVMEMTVIPLATPTPSQ